MPRASGPRPGVTKQLGSSTYKTSDGEFAVYTTQSQLGGGVRRAEIILERVSLDPDDAFTGNYEVLPNRVGLIFEVNHLNYAAADLAKLQTAIVAFVDSTLRGRLVGGEL
jgi:hypothetical protein